MPIVHLRRDRAVIPGFCVITPQAGRRGRRAMRRNRAAAACSRIATPACLKFSADLRIDAAQQQAASPAGHDVAVEIQRAREIPGFFTNRRNAAGLAQPRALRLVR
jgi:hypothetical protein